MRQDTDFVFREKIWSRTLRLYKMTVLDDYLGLDSCIVFSSLSHVAALKQSGLVSQEKLDQATIYSTDKSTSDENGNIRSIWLDLTQQTYRHVIVSHTFVLYRGGFGIALVDALASMVRPGGVLILPVGNKSRNERDLEHFCKQLEEPQSLLKGPNGKVYAVFTSPGHIYEGCQFRSTLDWYRKGVFDILLDKPRQNDAYSALRGASLEDLENFGMFGEFVTRFSPASELNPEPSTPLSLAEFSSCNNSYVRCDSKELLRSDVDAQSYSVGGLRYKAPIISHIVANLVPDKSGLHLTDLGGGYGNLAAEILLDEVNGVDEVSVIDPSLRYMVFAEYLYRGLHSALKGRFSYQLCSMEKYSFHPTDVICMIGSYLFVNRGYRRAHAKRLFELLRPGGLLIVHENIRNERYARVKEFDFMFTASELDDYLGSLAPQRFFMPTYFSEISNNEVGDKSVFRVVQKPR